RHVVLLDVVVTHEVQQGGQLLEVVHGQGGAQAHPNVALAAQPGGIHGQVKTTGQAPERIVGFGQAIDADADVVVADIGNLVDIVFGNQRAIGGQRQKEALAGSIFRQGKDVRPHQGFATAQYQHPYAGIMQVIDHAQGFGGVQFAPEMGIGGRGVAVLAGQVAAPQQVPDNHRGTG